MKLIISCLLAVLMLACQQSSENGAAASSMSSEGSATLATSQDSMSYAYGLVFGENISAASDNMNLAALIKGIQDGVDKKGSMTTDMARQQSSKFMQVVQEAMVTKNKAEGESFLAEMRAQDGVVTLPSGLMYKVITPGTGKSPKATDRVKTHYRGTFADGRQFDSSYDRGQPAEFAVNRVIPGWTEGLQLMKEGGKWELYIPSDLAYGARGNRGIPPNTALKFEVELIEVLGTN